MLTLLDIIGDANRRGLDIDVISFPSSAASLVTVADPPVVPGGGQVSDRYALSLPIGDVR